MQPFARGDVNDPRIRRRYRDGTDRLRGLRIEDRYPGAPIVIGFPHAAIDRTRQKRARLARHAGDRTRSATPEWTDQAPFHVLDNRGSADFRAGQRGPRKDQEDGDEASIETNRQHVLSLRLKSTRRIIVEVASNTFRAFPETLHCSDFTTPCRAAAKTVF